MQSCAIPPIRCRCCPRSTAATACIPTTPATRPWPTPSICRFSANNRDMGKTATLPIDLHGSRDRTLQEQIYLSVRRCIVEGRIGAGRRLPSTRALAAELGVSRTTVLLAIDNLQAEGYLVARRGAGTFVASELPDP